MWSEIILTLKKYIGSGWLAGLFVAAVLYLLFVEKDRVKRIILLYISIVTLALFFFPLFAQMIFRYLDKETYYRILWLVPQTAVIAYAGVYLVAGISKRWLKTLAALAICALLAGAGDYVYDNPYFSRAENRFHVPQAVALICDAIIVEGGEVQAAFPAEMLPYVRQYTANIRMPYGRELLMEGLLIYNFLYNAISKDEIDCQEIALLAAEQNCDYVILHEAKKGQEGFEKTDYRYQETIAGYRIYARRQQGKS